MNYLAYLFLSKMPCCLERRLIIDGKEEVCLVLPTKKNQIKKGKLGTWMMMCRLAECEPNEAQQTHDVQLTYLTEEAVRDSYDFGYHRRTAHLGRVYEHDRTPEKKVDRTNYATDVKLDGEIVLSDIEKSLIFKGPADNKRYITNLVIRGLPDIGLIYKGSVCVDDIDAKSIFTDPNTGKKKIRVKFHKLPRCDCFMNTHELVMVTEDGSEFQIGLFKEFESVGGVKVPPQPQPTDEEIHNTGVNQRQMPSEIGGIKF